jgi:hypothetical protein
MGRPVSRERGVEERQAPASALRGGVECVVTQLRQRPTRSARSKGLFFRMWAGIEQTGDGK